MINTNKRFILNYLVLILKIGGDKINITVYRKIITDFIKIITARLLKLIQSSNNYNIVISNSFNSCLSYLLISRSSLLLFL
jgi:hypothetical protein